MKKSLTAMLLVLAAMTISVVSHAGPVYRPQPAKPVQITVAVAGLTDRMSLAQLRQDLAKLPGVTNIKVTLAPAQVSAKLDETQTTVSQFVNAIDAHPTALDENTMYHAQLLLFVDTQACAEPASAKREGAAGDSGVLALRARHCYHHPRCLRQIVGVTFLPNACVKTRDLAQVLANSDLRFACSFASPARATHAARHQFNKGPVLC